jgi:hypothetical protein
MFMDIIVGLRVIWERSDIVATFGLGIVDEK